MRIFYFGLLICLAASAYAGPVNETPQPPLQENKEDSGRWEPLQGLTLDFKNIEWKGVGLDYKYEPFAEYKDKPRYFGGGFIDSGVLADFSAEGYLSTVSKEDDESVRALSARGDLFVHSNVAEIAGSDWWVDLGITAFEFEADQDFEDISYIFKPYIAAPIPGSELISESIHKLFGGSGKARPLPGGGLELATKNRILVRAGYSLVSKLEGDNPRNEEDRFELTATWRLELVGDSSLRTSYRHFFESGDDYGLLEVKLDVPITKETSMIVKYMDGELPPSLRSSETVSAGFSISF